MGEVSEATEEAKHETRWDQCSAIIWHIKQDFDATVHAIEQAKDFGLN